MGLPEDWTLHREFPEEHLTVNVDHEGIWLNYGSRDPVCVTWEEVDDLRPLTEEAKPARFISRAK